MTFPPKDGLSYRSRRAIALSAAAVALLAAAALPSTASAQATRTWVSGVGDDVNPCSRTAPCKTWAGAISKTAAGGIINALDNGAFGCVTITKSLTLKTKSTSPPRSRPPARTASPSTRAPPIASRSTASTSSRAEHVPGRLRPPRAPGRVGARRERGDLRPATAGILFEPSNANAKLIVQNSSIYANTNPAQHHRQRD